MWARVKTVLSTLMRHDSLVVITMMIFIQHYSDIHDPVSVLLRFLEIFSVMDWDKSLITVLGIRLKSDEDPSSSIAYKVSRINDVRELKVTFVTNYLLLFIFRALRSTEIAHN